MEFPRRLLPFVLVFLFLPIPFLMALSSVDHPTGAGSFDQAVDKLFAHGYPQELEAYFCSLGTNPELGFRWAGTTAEHAVSKRVEAEMRAMGLSNVGLEPVPVDIFEFERASLTVGSRAMIASTIGGVPPTPKGGIIARVIYVGGGTAPEFDAAGDVAGKLVLVDAKTSSCWFNLPAFEAMHRKAAGVICTYTPDDPKYYSINDQALGSFDGQFSLDAPPWIYISRRDGDWLKSALKSGPVTATMILEEKVTLARDGGQAYNVVGKIPGSRRDGQMVLMAAHQDVHFRAGADDTGALVNMLVIAKAMRESGFKPKNTIVFLATCGEEFGYTDAYYDWCIGAWWAATHAHADWAGKVRGMLNLETMALKGAPLFLRVNPELKPWLESLAAKASVLLPYGSEVLTPVSSWNDQWTFTAAGVPSVKIDASDEEYDKLYHSNFDTAAIVDMPYLAKIAKFVFLAAEQLDIGLLPYSLKARAEDLCASVKMDDLQASGADPALISRLSAAVEDFQTSAAAFDARSGSIQDTGFDAVNSGLLAVEKALNGGLTALSPADDDSTVYPHMAVWKDAMSLGEAIAALKSTPPDRGAALKALTGMYLTRLGILFSHPVYLKQLSRLDPSFGLITWGGQGQLPMPLDVVPEYRRVESGDYAGAVASLEVKLKTRIDELNIRLAAMASLLEKVTPLINSLGK